MGPVGVAVEPHVGNAVFHGWVPTLEVNLYAVPFAQGQRRVARDLDLPAGVVVDRDTLRNQRHTLRTGGDEREGEIRS